MNFWNPNIINLSDRYFGMDLSDLSVKVFQLERRGSLDIIRSFGSKEISPGLMESGRIIDKEKIIETIKEVIRTSGPKKINTKKVICSVPESKVFLRTISIPRVSEDEAGEAIKWEIEASIPMSVDQVYYDWQFLGQEGGKQNVLTVAVAKETINDLMEVLASSGLQVYGLEMEAIATIRSLIPKRLKGNNQDGTYLTIDLGAEKTSFIVSRGNIPFFTSSIPFSSSGINDVIASRINVSRDEAEKIKVLHGIERSEENASVFNSLKPFLENLSVEIEKTIDFYHNMSKSDLEIEKILITGGGANLKGVVSYLATRLSREVLMGDPWINLNLGKNLPLINKNDSVRYATAIGLAMQKNE